jgi:hypothetical protein
MYANTSLPVGQGDPVLDLGYEPKCWDCQAPASAWLRLSNDSTVIIRPLCGSHFNALVKRLEGGR